MKSHEVNKSKWQLVSSPPMEAADTLQQNLPSFTKSMTEQGHALVIFSDFQDSVCRYHFIYGVSPQKDGQWIPPHIFSLFQNSDGIRMWQKQSLAELIPYVHQEGRDHEITVCWSNIPDAATLLPSSVTHQQLKASLSPKPASNTVPPTSGFVAINSVSTQTAKNASNTLDISGTRSTKMGTTGTAPVHEASGSSTMSVDKSREIPRAPVDDYADDLDNDYYDDDEMESEAEFSDDDESHGFRSKKKLETASISRRTMDDLVNLMDTPYLDLDPEYQRDVVWNPSRMSALINSLLENFYIPPVIFNRTTIEGHDGVERVKRICVDGKQRLSSVKEFMAGEIPCHDLDGRTWWYCDKVGSKSRRRILPEQVKREFRRKEFVCYEYEDLENNEEEDLFARVQKGMALTAAEKMRATNGPWQNLAKKFEERFMEVVTLSTTKRSTGFRNVLTCFAQIIEVQHPSSAAGIPVFRMTAGALDSFVRSAPMLDKKMEEHFKAVFKTFQDLVRTYPKTFENNGYLHSTKFAPVELVATAVLISMYHESRNLFLLSGDILAMRTTIRQNHKDLKMNGGVWKSLWEFLDTLEEYRGTVDGSIIPIREDSGPPAPLSPVAPSRVTKMPKPPLKKSQPLLQTASPASTQKNEKQSQKMQSAEAAPPVLVSDVNPHPVQTSHGLPAQRGMTSKQTPSKPPVVQKVQDTAQTSKKMKETPIPLPTPKDAQATPVSTTQTPKTLSVPNGTPMPLRSSPQSTGFRAVNSTKPQSQPTVAAVPFGPSQQLFAGRSQDPRRNQTPFNPSLSKSRTPPSTNRSGPTRLRLQSPDSDTEQQQNQANPALDTSFYPAFPDASAPAPLAPMFPPPPLTTPASVVPRITSHPSTLAATPNTARGPAVSRKPTASSSRSTAPNTTVGTSMFDPISLDDSDDDDAEDTAQSAQQLLSEFQNGNTKAVRVKKERSETPGVNGVKRKAGVEGEREQGWAGKRGKRVAGLFGRKVGEK